MTAMQTALGRFANLPAQARRFNTPAVQRWALFGAAIIFAGGLFLSLRNLDLTLSDLKAGPILAVCFLAIPASILFNWYETWLSARMVGKNFTPGAAMKITIIAGAANALPIPGAAIVRITSLNAAGASLAASTSTAITIAALWLGVAFMITGAFLLGFDAFLGAGALAAGAGALAGGLYAAHRISGATGFGLQIVLLKTALTALTITRMGLCLAALNIEASIAQVSVFAVSGVLGSAASIVPAGLGVRELIAAALAPLTGLSASAAFLAAALNRALAMTILMTLSLCLNRRRK